MRADKPCVLPPPDTCRCVPRHSTERGRQCDNPRRCGICWCGACCRNLEVPMRSGPWRGDKKATQHPASIPTSGPAGSDSSNFIFLLPSQATHASHGRSCSAQRLHVLGLACAQRRTSAAVPSRRPVHAPRRCHDDLACQVQRLLQASHEAARAPHALRPASGAYVPRRARAAPHRRRRPCRPYSTKREKQVPGRVRVQPACWIVAELGRRTIPAFGAKVRRIVS